MQKSEQKQFFTLTPEAFRRFLEWLDEGSDSGGGKYLEMRRRLASYFDRKNCLSPDELADETLNRVARRLDEEGIIESDAPAKYCYTVARFVFLENLRQTRKEPVPLEDVLLRQKDEKFPAPESGGEKEIKEVMLDCLEQCTGKLDSSSREIIIQYYFGKERVKIENRRALAERLGITVNALSIRACRIREKLETCVKKCVG